MSTLEASVKKGLTQPWLLLFATIVGVIVIAIIIKGTFIIQGTKGKSQDTSIVASAQSMMQAIQLTSFESGNYSNYIGISTSDIASCTHYAKNASNKQMLQDACAFILRNNQNSDCGGDNPCFWSNSLGNGYQKLSLMVWLPFSQKYYCLGSNGKSSYTNKGNLSTPGCSRDTSDN
jgi:hypothetical protein